MTTWGYHSVATFIIAFFVTIGAAHATDSTYVLRLNLPVGTSYSYKVITDQFIVPKTAARLHSMLSFNVLSRDLASNLHCHVKLTSDTVFKSDDAEMYKPEGDLTFVGNKLYSGVGYVDVLLDEFGHIISSKHVMVEDSGTVNEDAITRATDAGAMGVPGDVGPYGINLIIPAVPDAVEMGVGVDYTDTVLFASRLLYMPTHYGNSALSEKKHYYDTLIRVTRLDSTLLDDVGAIHGYMTLRGERRNAFGAKFYTETSLIRDMRSGLLSYVTEMCYQIKKNKQRKYYKVTAELINQKRLGHFR